MEMRIAKKGANIGEQFWGALVFPNAVALAMCNSANREHGNLKRAIRSLTVRVFGYEREAEKWLNKPFSQLESKTPLYTINSDGSAQLVKRRTVAVLQNSRGHFANPGNFYYQIRPAHHQSAPAPFLTAYHQRGNRHDSDACGA